MRENKGQKNPNRDTFHAMRFIIFLNVKYCAKVEPVSPQTTNTGRFRTIVNGWKPLIIVATLFNLDIWEGPGCMVKPLSDYLQLRHELAGLHYKSSYCLSDTRAIKISTTI